MSHYKPYPAYKDSGVEWIGEVPEHWKVTAIKRVSPVFRGASPRPIDDPKYFDDEGQYGWVRISDVSASDGYLYQTEQKLSDLGSSLSVKLPIDSLFLSIAGSVGKPCISKIDACIHDGFVYFPFLKIDPMWLFRVFETKRPFVGLGKLGTQLNLNTETVGGIYIGLPPPAETESILAAITMQTTRIDALIAKKTRFIELLKEKRQALITHAVTKGLDSNVKMKDSGVEWIGEVPEHWDTIKIARLGPLTKANGGSKQDNIDSGVPCIRYGDLYTTHEYFIRGSRSYIGPDKLGEYTPIRYGDALFAASGETFEDIGRSAVNLLREEACSGGDVIVLRPTTNLDPLFLGYALDSMSSKAQKALMGKGYTVVHIYADQLRALIVALPPATEQEAIGTALNRAASRIDVLIAKTQRSIDLLKERRSAFITAAVTGQIDLRGAS